MGSREHHYVHMVLLHACIETYTQYTVTVFRVYVFIHAKQHVVTANS